MYPVLYKKSHFSQISLLYSKKLLISESFFVYFPHYFSIFNIFMSDSQLISAIQWDFLKQDLPELETGMEVEVHQIIKEWSKERTQIFRWLIITVHGSSPMSRSITVRSELDGVGIEKVFPIHSPYIQKIVVLRKFLVRRKHIGFIRNLRGKAARLKEIKPTATAEWAEKHQKKAPKKKEKTAE